MKNIYIASLIAAAAVLASAAIHAQNQFRGEQLHKKAPAVPEFIIFAGDTISFSRSDLYERMDREIISFTYMHSTSLLLLKRGPGVFARVEPILKRLGMPDDLKYLMAIESTLDPSAVSSAGAAGLWQFTKATGQKYGLEINSEVDERYNTAKATQAACSFLKEAYEKYGDWMTAAASYNGGQNGISAKLEDQHCDSALDLWLVEETSRYMFRLLAVKMLYENPEAFGFHLEPEESYNYPEPQKTVTISEPIPSLVDFAGEYGISYAQLKRENRWLRSDKLTNKDRKAYKIDIPAPPVPR